MEFQDPETEINFTFTPVMTVTLSSKDLSINNLAPGNTGTGSVSVSVATNNYSGYTLKATVGSASNASTNLTNTNGTFSMVSAAGSTLAPGEWGYKTSSAATTYSPIVLYTATTPTTINSSTGPTNAGTGETNFYIGAYADTTQAPGEYTNVINFIATTNGPTS